MAKRKATGAAKASGANLGDQAQLWQMADALRGGIDTTEYKHVCPGLLFLCGKHLDLTAGFRNPVGCVR